MALNYFTLAETQNGVSPTGITTEYTTTAVVHSWFLYIN